MPIAFAVAQCLVEYSIRVPKNCSSNLSPYLQDSSANSVSYSSRLPLLGNVLVVEVPQMLRQVVLASKGVAPLSRAVVLGTVMPLILVPVVDAFEMPVLVSFARKGRRAIILRTGVLLVATVDWSVWTVLMCAPPILNGKKRTWRRHCSFCPCRRIGRQGSWRPPWCLDGTYTD
jgi:hypothetical protein